MKFEELGLSESILKAAVKSGFTEPTPIQASAIPAVKQGRDVVAQSLTGSGKTAAFGFPLLEKINPGQGIQVLILTPTRELTEQVKETLISFSSFMKIHITAVYGGVSLRPQFDAVRRADIVVATPGRLLDHIQRRSIYLDNIRFLVIDEADKMFEMGFIDDVKQIIRFLPKERQTMLFSATMPAEIIHLIDAFLKNPLMIQEQVYVDKNLLKQFYYDVEQYDKFSLLVHLLKKKTPGLAIVFCGTRREVDIITRNLKSQGIEAQAVHGGLSQNRRSNAVNSLKSQNIDVLVATDVAARGLDIRNISHIYNYDSPKNATEYTHRIGRTARAGHYGEAVTLLAARDHDNFRMVTRDGTLPIEREELPEFERVPFQRNTPGRGRFSGKQRFGQRGGHGGHQGPRRFSGKPRFGGGGFRSQSREGADSSSDSQRGFRSRPGSGSSGQQGGQRRFKPRFHHGNRNQRRNR